jgi:hypothetical protein
MNPSKPRKVGKGMTDQPEVQPSTPVADHRDLDDHTPKKAGFMKAENIIRMVQTVLLTAVAGFAISVVVAGHWWETPAPPPPPPPTVNVKSVGDQVVGLLREQWNGENLQEYGIAVDDGLSLINTDLNKYDGLATVHTRAGTQKFLSVTVWADPTGAMFYQMDVASATNLMDAAKKEEPNRCWVGSC